VEFQIHILNTSSSVHCEIGVYLQNASFIYIYIALRQGCKPEGKLVIIRNIPFGTPTLIITLSTHSATHQGTKTTAANDAAVLFGAVYKYH
jgi:hypothetical protein